MSDFIYIQAQNQLNQAVEQLAKTSRIAIDTESSGYYTYFSELCLIQISASERHYIIDPFAKLDLHALRQLCENKSITKIFHSAASDIIELKRTYGWEFHNVFDTFLACRLLGHASCSLVSLVAEYENIHLEKKEQKSNWKQRPLTRSQLKYAHLDTVYLEKLMDQLKSQLEEYGMYQEIKEEFERICKMQIEEQKPIDTEAWRHVKDTKRLSDTERLYFRELYQLRELYARRENIASFRLVSNAVLLRLAKERPSELSQSAIAKFFHPNFLKKESSNIIKLLQTNPKSLAPIIVSKSTGIHIDPETKLIFKKLKKWRTRISEYRGIDPAMVLSNRNLNQIARIKPPNLQKLSQLELMTSWKLKNYAQQVLDIINGIYDGSIPEELTRLPHIKGD